MIFSSLLRFFSTPSSTRQEHEKQIHRRSFAANLILLLGYIFGVWYQGYEFNGRAREVIAITVYFLAFSLLVISGIVELSVDIFSVRKVGHGRYCSDSPKWNRIISLLFIAVGIVDIVSFCFWVKRDFDTEEIVLNVSGYLLLIMSTLVLIFQLQEPIDDTPDKIDLAANWLVFVGAILNLFERQILTSSSAPQRQRMLDHLSHSVGMTERMELTIVIFFLISAVLYVSADLIRIYSSASGDKSPQSPTPTQETGV